jgi:catechol 2,3-dioxygenase-like lactoylglutathione lyase family enzyme
VDTVEPRASLITLGVSDLERAVAFYRDGLGWPKFDVGGDEGAFFKMGGVVIALFPTPSFAADAGIDVDDVEHPAASPWGTPGTRIPLRRGAPGRGFSGRPTRQHSPGSSGSTRPAGSRR